ncbi:hypothetical protein [Lactobacillus sp.]|uniref:hypothetical protein n=1 Tax=Lactobacillus sp. TaxID=1591 RepID=UPI0019AD4669|nr:hypothetical protein [Lactobacillus sp.]MBD5430117.1 hypothetical protein [Lactobacillus sp.]
MSSENKTTQIEEKDTVLVEDAFGQSPSERLKRAQDQQAAIEEAQHKQDLKMIGWVLVAAFIGLLAGLAL